MFNQLQWEFRDFPVLFEAKKFAELGISRHALLKSQRYPVVLPGVRMDTETFTKYPVPLWADWDWMRTAQRLRAASLKKPGIVGAHATAAQLYGWPLPQRLMTSHLHVASNDRNLRLRLPNVTLHRTIHHSLRNWFGLPLLDAADVIIGLAAELALPELVRLGDAAVGNWHGPPQISLTELNMKARRPQIRARSHLRAGLELVRETVDSPKETDLRLWLRSVGLPEPVVHPSVHSALLGQSVEPDLGYPDALLALEYEGEHHLLSRRQWAHDIERYEALHQEGWTVLRVTSRTDFGQLEQKILHHLRRQ